MADVSAGNNREIIETRARGVNAKFHDARGNFSPDPACLPAADCLYVADGGEEKRQRSNESGILKSEKSTGGERERGADGTRAPNICR